MTSFEFDLDGIMQVCTQLQPTGDTRPLLEKLAPYLGGLEMEPVSQRGGWYRLGGLINAEGERITDDLVAWIEAETGDDMAALWDLAGDAGYRVTKRVGKTHYFTAPTGEGPEEFVQLEVEEIQEITDRLLLDPADPAEDLQDLLDPVNYTPLPADPVGPAQYHFRRITPIASLMKGIQERGANGNSPLRRFMADWTESSAREHRFSEHWILMLRQETGRYGELQRSAKPSPAYIGDLPKLEFDPDLRGVDLAKRINVFDREIGYPFAWYFLMLTSRAVPKETTQQILRDLMGAYDYLPARDLKVLRRWSDKPYAV